MELSATTLVLIAIISALGLVRVVAVDTISIFQDVEAKGCPNSVAVNASKGRCLQF
ncbi:MAG TPA: hypothetical protein VJ599_00780 [Nitrososphaeraceae archaeon]|nr:hypothetical protein [Nitrososphaeraceae archaeon]